MVITTAQLYSTKPEVRFCACFNPAPDVTEIRDGGDLWQWSRLQIRLNVFRRSTIPQKQFVMIISSSSPSSEVNECYFVVALNVLGLKLA